MKRETLRHPKLFDLTARLGCSRPEALGYLQLLWDFTAEYAIQGNVGKHADGAIARACDWSGDSRAFINGLTAAGWLDEDSEHRLLVHDWLDHCERWVKLKAGKLNLEFITHSTESSIERSTESATEASPPRDQSNPNQSHPGEGASAPPTCPYGKIVDSYHEHCPRLPRVQRLTDKRRRSIRARWREDDERQDLAWWTQYFQKAGNTPFLNGENDRQWRADLEWLINEANMVKVLEGKYATPANSSGAVDPVADAELRRLRAVK